MAKYVVLVNWTAQGVASASETTQRAARVEELARRLGGSSDLLLWTLGRYDLVGVFDMPSDEAMATLGMQVSGQGNVHTETLRAFTADEVEGIIAGLSGGDGPTRGGGDTPSRGGREA
jgi:uncharacterized protein with GYD domain